MRNRLLIKGCCCTWICSQWLTGARTVRDAQATGIYLPLYHFFVVASLLAALTRSLTMSGLQNASTTFKIIVWIPFLHGAEVATSMRARILVATSALVHV